MKKIFTIGSKSNIFILCISYLAYPLSIFLHKIRLSPNFVTSLSLIFAIISCYFLTFGNQIFFCFFWFISSLLDFCDGQISRISKNINKTAFNYDGLGDLFKIFIIIICSGINYQDNFYWIVCAITVFLFPFFSILTSTYSNNRFKKKINLIGPFKIKYKISRKIIRNFVSIFFKIDGHSLFLFLLLPVSKLTAILLLLYFIFLLMINSFRFTYLLLNLKK